MKLQFIELGKLAISKTNMRYAKKAPDVSDLLPTVRARGVLVPLIVRPNCAPGSFEIIAGARRPMIYVGGGAIDAAEDIARLAEEIQAPVASFRSGRGIVTERCELINDKGEMVISSEHVSMLKLREAEAAKV